MAYSIDEAKELVVRAGKMLVSEGLTARTWGNISARISDTQFVITPSGLPYESLTPEHIVTVNISDSSYEGRTKPSSEKGIHADAYRLRADVNFVIHTHQKLASAVSVAGRPLMVTDDAERSVLGDTVPCAGYGLPSTKALRRKVAAEIEKAPEARAFLMKNHGALCLGADLESTFETARALEAAARREYSAAVSEGAAREISELGSSRRSGGGFYLKLEGGSVFYFINALPDSAPDAARLHAALYKSARVGCILHCREPEAAELSRSGEALKPYLDDLAQIAGARIKCAAFDAKRLRRISRALGRREAVLIKGAGALCVGADEHEARGVESILCKACAAALYARVIPQRCCLGSLDARLQRLYYKLKYSRQGA